MRPLGRRASFQVACWTIGCQVGVLLLAALPAVSAVLAAERARADSAPRPSQPPSGAPDVTTVPAKLYRFAERVIAKYDRDGDGELDNAELTAAPESIRQAERNDQGRVGVNELADHLAAYARSRSLRRDSQAWQNMPEFPPLLQPSTPGNPAGDRPAPGLGEPEEKAKPTGPRSNRPTAERRFYIPPSQFPAGLPDWFLQRDADGDGQLTLTEFAPSGGAATVAEFHRYDLNHDGLATPEEILQVLKAAKVTPAAKAPAGKAKHGKSR